jgi:hypothetical protein
MNLIKWFLSLFKSKKNKDKYIIARGCRRVL